MTTTRAARRSTRWMRDQVPAKAITFCATDTEALESAVLTGAGIGFLPIWKTAQREDVVEIISPKEEWSAPLWLVTHVDLHRTNKVQSFLSYLKARAKDWTV